MKQQYKFPQLVLLAVFLMLMCNMGLRAQSVNHVWSAMMGATVGGPTTGRAESYSIAIDASGNSYVTGKFSGTVDFDPGPTVNNLTSVGSGSANDHDIFISKLDPQGNFVWTKSIGATGVGSGGDEGKAITVDASGNIIISGTFQGTVDFDPGTGVNNLVSNGGKDIFILKMDASGNFIWVKSIGGTTNVDELSALSLDATGNIYITGSFQSSVDFDPGFGSFSLTALADDIFMLKLDAAGNFQWVKQIGGAGGDRGYDIAIDASGNIVLIGLFNGTVDFDPSSVVYNLTASATDNMFVTKFDASGGFLWAKHFSGLSAANNIGAVSIDLSGNIYTTGSFTGTVDFDPSSAVLNLSSTDASSDIFISKLDASGNFVWAKKIGEKATDISYAIKVDAGGVYVSGRFTNNADFDPGTNVFTTGTSGSVFAWSGFILKLDASGNFVWARDTPKKLVSTSNSLDHRAIALDGLGNIYAAGNFRGGTADFDPGPGLVNIISVTGVPSVFVQKLSQKQCGAPTYSSLTTTACDSFVLGGYKYTTTGIYSALTVNKNGCDSIVNLDLTIKKGSSSTFTREVCDSTAFNGEVYKATGLYTQVYTNAVGCDSFVTLNLTVKNSTFRTINETACQSYTLNGITYTATGVYGIDTIANSIGCDSITVLNLIIKNSTSTLTEVACDSFSLNGTTYKSSGVYTQTIGNSAGCDSMITLNLTINSVDASVTKNGATITANTAGATYQWVDCNKGYSAIAGETGQSYTATFNGSYAVVVTLNGCTDTSECRAVTHLTDGVEKIGNDHSFRVYPNPGNSVFTLSTDYPLQSATVKIMNMTGQVVLERMELNGNSFNFDIEPYADGVYIMEIVEAGKSMQVKLVKQ